MKISYPKRIVEIKSLYDQLPIVPIGLNPLVNTQSKLSESSPNIF